MVCNLFLCSFENGFLFAYHNLKTQDIDPLPEASPPEETPSSIKVKVSPLVHVAFCIQLPIRFQGEEEDKENIARCEFSLQLTYTYMLLTI